MNSLRRRLLAGLLCATALFWAAEFGIQWLQLSRQQTGTWDASIEAIGQQILLSLPPTDAVNVAAQPTYALPAQGQQRDAGAKHMAWQVWARDGRALVRSGGAPLEPFVPVDASAPDGFARAQAQGDTWRVYALWDQRRQVQVQVAKSQRQLDAQLAQALQDKLQAMLLLTLLLAGVVWWVVRWSLAPVARVSASISQISLLDLRPVAAAELPQELRPLVDAFNNLLQRLDSALQSERRLLADAAHELRTPLAVLLAQAQLAQSAPAPEQQQAALAALVTGIERSARLTEQLLDLARLDAEQAQAHRARQPLHELVALVVHDFDGVARAAEQRLLLHTDPCAAPVDVDAIGILVRNLLDNALRYAGHGARVEVICRYEADSDHDCAALSVRDDGPGVPQSERKRIFDRFYRVPGSAARGSGIGLSLVARIAEMHGATIAVGEGLGGRGFGITVRFPTPVRLVNPVDPAQRAAPQSRVGPVATFTS